MMRRSPRALQVAGYGLGIVVCFLLTFVAINYPGRALALIALVVLLAIVAAMAIWLAQHGGGVQ